MGKVKQIIGSTLSNSKENGFALVTNFVSDKSAREYAKMYKEDGLTGGHAIMLGADPLSRAATIEGRQICNCHRWQKFSDVYLDEEILDFLANYADEFLVYGVDVEEKKY
ncbi:hypothetical protein GBA52_026487 [Prunus armeniaca]|nr:hypothetical protein GBA52_026487 [Prunus armeniaca]